MLLCRQKDKNSQWQKWKSMAGWLVMCMYVVAWACGETWHSVSCNRQPMGWWTWKIWDQAGGGMGMVEVACAGLEQTDRRQAGGIMCGMVGGSRRTPSLCQPVGPSVSTFSRYIPRPLSILKAWRALLNYMCTRPWPFCGMCLSMNIVLRVLGSLSHNHLLSSKQYYLSA